MSKTLTPFECFICLLLLTIWVGGMWLSILVIFPSLKYTLLASILIYDVITVLAERIVMAIMICTVILLAFYMKAIHYKQFIKSPLTITLLLAICIELFFLCSGTLYMLSASMMVYTYAAIAAIGLFSMVQLIPWLSEQQNNR